MPRKNTPRSRNGHLEEALVNLINNQALFIGSLARMDERFARIDERFARMESDLAAIKSILVHHEKILESLPEVIRQKIGFKP